MTTEINIRWVDIDAYGHVNNSRYFDYMTEARARVLSRHFQELGGHLQFILVDTHCNFARPIHYPATLYLKQWVTRIGNSSFELGYAFFTDKEQSTEHAKGQAKMVCFDPKEKKAAKIPPSLKDYLESMML